MVGPAGAAGLHWAEAAFQCLNHPSIQPFALAATVFVTNLIQLHSSDKEVAEWLLAVRSPHMVSVVSAYRLRLARLEKQLHAQTSFRF